jgi:hypothetical protein
LLIGGGEGAAGGDAVSTFVLLSSTGRGGEGAGGDAVSTSVLSRTAAIGGCQELDFSHPKLLRIYRIAMKHEPGAPVQTRGRVPLTCCSFHEDFFFVFVRATEAVLDLRAIRRES